MAGIVYAHRDTLKKRPSQLVAPWYFNIMDLACLSAYKTERRSVTAILT